MRISDILTVKWGNLDVERDPMVLNIITRKQDKPLSVPIFPLAEEVLLFAHDKYYFAKVSQEGGDRKAH